MSSFETPPAVAAAMERARAAGFTISSEDCVGRLLAVLAAAVPAGGRVLEMGTGVGMGTAWIVTGLGKRRDAEVVTVERDACLAEALRGWPWPAFVRLVQANALDALGWLGTFDLVFPDSHAGKYLGFDRTLAALRPGGLLVVDDMMARRLRASRRSLSGPSCAGRCSAIRSCKRSRWTGAAV